jgi:hypothetical protein
MSESRGALPLSKAAFARAVEEGRITVAPQPETRMSLVVTLDLEGLALAGDDGVPEMREILHGLASKVDSLWSDGTGGWKHHHGFTIMDSNGDRVGQAEIRKVER